MTPHLKAWAYPWPSRLFIQVWRRHLLVWRKTAGASLAGNFIEPILYLVGLGYGLGRFVGDLGGMPYLLFIASGILAANAMNTSTFEAFYGGFTRMTRQNTFQAMLATPLGVAEVVAGEVVWAATKSVMAGGAILAVGTLLGAFPATTAPLALPVIFLTGLVFGSIGMVVTALAPNYDYFLYHTSLVGTPMILFCGVFYPVDSLPEWLQTLSLALPLTHVVALIRPLSTGAGELTGLGWHLGILLLFLATAFHRAVRLIERRILV
ncbi:MAG: ABC transporter permease [Magnetococcales bacterium]|nr:ABC transporter permease [Magnetococcales bacterium]MBF0157611.1 ABC transporter permease [Magnetococcales bacterium]